MGSGSDPIARNHLEVRSELKEYIATGLIGVDAYAIHGEDGGGFLINAELHNWVFT